MEQNFKGFEQDTFQFFMEIAFNNDRAFYEANRERCKRVVVDPMRALALDLLPTALQVNPSFNQKLTSIVARMNRDTRFSNDKRPYRDNLWMAFKPGDNRLSENLVLYFEIDQNGYGYGLGMYNSNPALMKPFRERAIADPERFLEIAGSEDMKKFRVEGEMFKKDRFSTAPEGIKPYINRSGISFCYYSNRPSRTFDPSLVDEVKEAFLAMKPMYRFIACLEV